MTESGRTPQAWEQRYREGKTHWDRGRASPALRHWLDSGALPAGRVLVPGCGQGHEVADLLRHGCEVTAVDIAESPVRRLRELLAESGLHAQVVQADLLHWQPDAPFDAIYEQTCICALEPRDWAAYVQRLGDWLVPGGRLLALFMQTGSGGGPPYDCPVADMRALFDSARWHWPDAAPLKVPHPTGLVEMGYLLTRCG